MGSNICKCGKQCGLFTGHLELSLVWTLVHSAFIRVTGPPLMNNEIVQSILSIYTALRTYLQALNSHIVVWFSFFTILCESLNVWLYYVTFVCGVMAISRRRPPPSSSVVVVVCCRRLSSSTTSNNLGHRPVDHSVGPSAHLIHSHRCPEPTSEARKTSITSPSAIFSGFGSCYPLPDRGVCHSRPRVHRSLTWPAN